MYHQCAVGIVKIQVEHILHSIRILSKQLWQILVQLQICGESTLHSAAEHFANIFKSYTEWDLLIMTKNLSDSVLLSLILD